MSPPDLVVADGGGAPEVAMVAAPVLAVAVFLLLERRARQRERSVEDEDPDAG